MAMPVVLILVIVVLVIITIVFFYRSIRDREVLPAEECAHKLYDANSGLPANLPDKFRGVFWMSTNCAPELMCVFDGGEFNPEKRYIKIDASGDLTWTYDTSTVGYFYWFGCLIAALFRSTFYLYFTDDSFTYCTMYLYAFDCIYVPLFQTWELEQADVKGEEGEGNTWLRHIYPGCSKTENEFLSYKLVKVLDKDGKRLPAFGEMIASLKKFDDKGNVIQAGVPVKDFTTKHYLQIINGLAKWGIPGMTKPGRLLTGPP